MFRNMPDGALFNVCNAWYMKLHSKGNGDDCIALANNASNQLSSSGNPDHFWEWFLP